MSEGIVTTEAVIDNGPFGTRTVRFETGRLARQAAGSAVAYLDDETMILSATTASTADHPDRAAGVVLRDLAAPPPPHGPPLVRQISRW